MEKHNLAETVHKLCQALEAAGEVIPIESVLAECLSPPHRQPASQPGGRPAIYAFFYKERCLKCGQVGPNSAARYTSQHYNPGSSRSNLASSLLRRGSEIGISEIRPADINLWIKNHTARVNLLFPTTTTKRALNFAEAFLHVAWKPVFEGREWRDWLNLL